MRSRAEDGKSNSEVGMWNDLSCGLGVVSRELWARIKFGVLVYPLYFSIPKDLTRSRNFIIHYTAWQPVAHNHQHATPNKQPATSNPKSYFRLLHSEYHMPYALCLRSIYPLTSKTISCY